MKWRDGSNDPFRHFILQTAD